MNTLENQLRQPVTGADESKAAMQATAETAKSNPSVLAYINDVEIDKHGGDASIIITYISMRGRKPRLLPVLRLETGLLEDWDISIEDARDQLPKPGTVVVLAYEELTDPDDYHYIIGWDREPTKTDPAGTAMEQRAAWLKHAIEVDDLNLDKKEGRIMTDSRPINLTQQDRDLIAYAKTLPRRLERDTSLTCTADIRAAFKAIYTPRTIGYRRIAVVKHGDPRECIGAIGTTVALPEGQTLQAVADLTTDIERCSYHIQDGILTLDLTDKPCNKDPRGMDDPSRRDEWDALTPEQQQAYKDKAAKRYAAKKAKRDRDNAHFSKEVASC